MVLFTGVAVYAPFGIPKFRWSIADLRKPEFRKASQGPANAWLGKAAVWEARCAAFTMVVLRIDPLQGLHHSSVSKRVFGWSQGLTGLANVVAAAIVLSVHAGTTQGFQSAKACEAVGVTY